MRTVAHLIATLTLVASFACTQGYPQDLPMQDVSYHLDFEDGADPVSFWVASGDYEVNAKAVTDEQAYEGQRSLKLDVTLTSGGYLYWSVPIRMVAEGELHFSARILAGEGNQASAGLGFNWMFPPTHHSGCGPFEDAGKPEDGWKLIEGDVVASGAEKASGVLPKYVAGGSGDEVGIYVDRWGIFLRGTPGQRVVIYVDDVRIEGRVPEDEAYQVAFAERWEPFAERWDARVAEWREGLEEAREAVAGLPELPERVASAADAARTAVTRAEKMIDTAANAGYARPTEVDELEANLRMAQLAPGTIGYIADAVARGDMLTALAVPAMSNARILPTEAVIPGEPGKPVAVAGCPGEYESGSFVLLPLADVTGVLVEPTELTGDAGAIPASAVDVKYVKVWYQAGRSIHDLRNKQLVPELLLNDPALVRVDFDTEENYLRSTAADGAESYMLASDPDVATNELAGVRPIDAETLQPIDLPTLQLQQYWVTVHLPEDAAPGAYAGALVVSSDGNPDVRVPLQVSVHPFELADAPLTYSVYYRAKLHESGEPTITSEQRSDEQYLAEMRDCQAHGVLHPTLYQGYDEVLLPKALELRAEAGLATDRLFSLGLGTGAAQDQAGIDVLVGRLRDEWLPMAERFGYDELYIYGIDEAKGERLAAQRAAWKAVQEEGAFTFVACYYGTFEAMGDLLDVAVLARKPDPDEAAKFHGVGSEAFTYAFPQVGPEEPETFRRNYGLVLWQAGYDGAMDYAYQHGFGHVWNDFDSNRYRDHNFTYPTVNGIVDTVQWEGFREAVDDTRYMATLLAAIEGCDDAQVKAEAQAWVDALDPQRDLDEVRAEMVGLIQRCLGAR